MRFYSSKVRRCPTNVLWRRLSYVGGYSDYRKMRRKSREAPRIMFVQLCPSLSNFDGQTPDKVGQTPTKSDKLGVCPLCQQL